MKFQTVKQDYETAFRSGDKDLYQALKIVIGEVDLERSRQIKVSKSGELLANNFNEDISLQATLKRFITDAKTLYASKKDESILKEIEIYERYVPKKMSDDEILAELKAHNFTALPDVMKHFKGKPVDMQRVRELFTS